ncbi:MAG TPA: coenzyme F420-0:L-glutamate ligase [Polyangiaceae bacterium]|nr:coenzyme F420-0:L-glutamate ligase [Polyangiaceae bacterium]
MELLGLEGIPEVSEGADLAGLLAEAADRAETPLEGGDVLVITQKIVSKSEGRIARLADVTPSAFARKWASQHRLDPRLIEIVLGESRRIVRMDRGVLIAETHHGFVCANAGVDLSNVAGGEIATLLPRDPDASARHIRTALRDRRAVELAVVVSDTFGRPWREGLVNVAIGVSGLHPLQSYVGARDPQGFPLQATIQARADELAAAAGLVSTKLNRVPAVVIKGFAFDSADGHSKDLLRAPDRDMFR